MCARSCSSRRSECAGPAARRPAARRLSSRRSSSRRSVEPVERMSARSITFSSSRRAKATLSPSGRDRLVRGPRHRGTPGPARWSPQAQRTSASGRADRARPAVSRTLCAQTTAVKEQMDRPDQQECRVAAEARRRPSRPRRPDQGADGAGPGLGSERERVGCARIFLMTAGSCSMAISRSRPPQCGYARTSISNAAPAGLRRAGSASEYRCYVAMPGPTDETTAAAGS
jgi:hypothetical protein